MDGDFEVEKTIGVGFPTIQLFIKIVGFSQSCSFVAHDGGSGVSLAPHSSTALHGRLTLKQSGFRLPLAKSCGCTGGEPVLRLGRIRH
jgi:hypothetical protein